MRRHTSYRYCLENPSRSLLDALPPRTASRMLDPSPIPFLAVAVIAGVYNGLGQEAKEVGPSVAGVVYPFRGLEFVVKGVEGTSG